MLYLYIFKYRTMKIRIRQAVICLLCAYSFNACDEKDDIFKECIIEENEVKEPRTRAAISTTVRSFEGETTPIVGTRQSYTVQLESSLSTNTRVRITPSSDAILIAYGNMYLREHVITVSAGSNQFSFAALITKPDDNVTITVASDYGGDFFVGKLNRITCKAPEINIEAPTSIFPNTQFEISTDYTSVPNLSKGYEWDCSSFIKIQNQYQSGSKIKMILQSPSKEGSYNVNVKVHGGYNQNGSMFSIGEATVPIKVVGSPCDIYLRTNWRVPLIVTAPGTTIEIDAYDENGEKYYDRYEWKMPEGYTNSTSLIGSNPRQDKQKIRVYKTGVYKFEARGVIKIGNKIYYSNWKTIEVYVYMTPCTIEYKVSKTQFLSHNNNMNISCGVMEGAFPFYFDEGDIPNPQFLISTDPKDPNIRYYYLIEGYDFLTGETIIGEDPVQASTLIDYFPGTGTPAETIKVNYK